ncbi:MAG TPA: response regulator [Archangium sp.]|uniref:response regulator n=1 Tax=Archangium sp. TaxID=1872627 RepID=UPI002E34CB91|nr:response regulator [Archangium sp.]HEX5754223.1 response regulator [Archangium sp.]
MKDPADVDKGSVLILVMESDPYIRALQQALLGERYTVHFVQDGAAALEAARRLHPKMLIADILVPKIDGLRVCKLLKQEPATSHIQVLIFSELLAERRAREAGAEAFLHKPIDERRFLGEVQRLLEQAPGREGQG